MKPEPRKDSMKVKELIALLQKMQPDTELLCQCLDEGDRVHSMEPMGWLNDDEPASPVAIIACKDYSVS